MSLTQLPPPPNPPTDPGFVADLKGAVAVWRTHPLLPVAALVIWTGVAIGSHSYAFVLFGMVFVLVEIGWVGVERIWYLRAFRGSQITPSELRRFWAAFFWRYAELGVLAAVPFGVLIVLAHDHLTALRVGGVVIGFAVDAALTFVTAALAFHTRRVPGAVSLGFRMIRDDWPSCAAYVLAPPLAVEAFSRLWWIGPLGVAGSYVVSGFAALLLLACKGASAAFFLRRYPCEDDGAAWAAYVESSPVPRSGKRRRPNVRADRMRESRRRGGSP